MSNKPKLFKKKWESHKDECPAEHFVSRCLDGREYERGEVETALAQADNVTLAFTHLVTRLHESGKLTDGDVYYIAEGYEREEYEE